MIKSILYNMEQIIYLFICAIIILILIILFYIISDKCKKEKKISLLDIQDYDTIN